jgi:hypothetical protein
MQVCTVWTVVKQIALIIWFVMKDTYMKFHLKVKFEMILHRKSQKEFSPESKVWDNVSETGLRKVKADAAQILQSHLGRVLVFQNVPVAQKLKKPELFVFLS